MILYFMNQRDAIRYLVEVRRDALAKPSSEVIVKTHLHETPGVEGVERHISWNAVRRREIGSCLLPEYRSPLIAGKPLRGSRRGNPAS